MGLFGKLIGEALGQIVSGGVSKAVKDVVAGQ